MPTYTIQIPGSGDTTIEVNDSVTISFDQACVFCFTPASANYFSKALPPPGQLQPTGSSWSATATAAGRGRTLHFWHSGPGGACIPEPATKRTITIGNVGYPLEP